ncbi:hypothetical protein ACFOZ5_12475 [Marinobacter lacisalsi]|uniref:Uncharacterized protein n=1 Tax=Marinobacter lacisalsi TaxID=475979 RepID=A0ABV8QJX4_9GAMM
MYSNGQITSTRKAGRFFILLGWLSLAVTGLVSVATILPMTGDGAERISAEEITILASLACVLLGLSTLYLWVGRALKTHRRWARIAGAVLAIFSLANIPLGTLIALVVLYYLHKGWYEAPPLA